MGRESYYYLTLLDIIRNSNAIGLSYNPLEYNIVGSEISNYVPYTHWKLASNSTGTSPQNLVYINGDVLNDDLNEQWVYYLYTFEDIFVAYYPTEADALGGTNRIGLSSNSPFSSNSPGDFIVGSGGWSNSHRRWRLASNSTGSSPQNEIYPNGVTLNDTGSYYLYPSEPPGLYYYSTEANALAYTNILGSEPSFLVGTFGPYTSWRIASNSTGTSAQNLVYASGDTLNNDGVYYLYPSAPCFLEGTTILCKVDGIERYVPVEQLTKGTLVKTCLNGYKPVVLLGKGSIQNPGDDTRTENRLYKCSTSNYPQLTEDLFITGCHSILEFPITDKQKEDTIRHLGRLFVTDKKYRLIACVDERAEPWNSKGMYTIYHFALEHENEVMNYGVYANGGLLVESCCIQILKDKSNMVCDVCDV